MAQGVDFSFWGGMVLKMDTTGDRKRGLRQRVIKGKLIQLSRIVMRRRI